MADDAYPLWKSTYTPLLLEQDIDPTDAFMSIRLGFLIAALDETCFGKKELTRVHFVPLPTEHPANNLYASYQANDRYLVYPVRMTEKTARLSVTLPIRGNAEERVNCLLLSVAAHEVRHRIQVRRPATVRYERAARRWHRGLTGSVMEAVHRELRESERNLTADDIKQACLTAELLFGANEYDASVVEHLVRERFTSDIGEAAAMVAADAPRALEV